MNDTKLKHEEICMRFYILVYSKGQVHGSLSISADSPTNAK